MSSAALGEALARIDSTSDILRGRHDTLRSEWAPEEPPVTLVMAGYADVLCGEEMCLQSDDVRRLLELIECLLIEGDGPTKNAVATGFLESLLSRASAGQFDFRSVSSLLGNTTRAYCRSWDDFTGNNTAGL